MNKRYNSNTKGRQQRRTNEKRPVRGTEIRQVNGSGRPVIYGVLPVLEALRANARKIERIVVAEGVREHRLGEIFDEARSHGLRVDKLRREELDRIAPTGANHQGIIAYSAAAAYATEDEILDAAGETPLMLLLDSVQDPEI